MKLYYWSDVYALADYHKGQVFVIAPSLDDARRLIRELAASGYDNGQIAAECDTTAPTVIDGPYAIFVPGGS